MNSASDYNLNAMVAEWAVEIFEQVDTEEGAYDLAHGYVDSSEWVIYHYKSHQICLLCDTSNGESMFIELNQEFGVDSGITYDSIASTIAYWEIHARLYDAITILYQIESELVQ